jgi:hypothetical protein
MGLISSKADTTRAKPSLAVRKKTAELSGIFNQTQEVVAVGPKTAAKYRSAGKIVIGNRVIIDKQPSEKVFRNRQGEIEIVDTFIGGGVGAFYSQIILPVNVRNFKDFYDWIVAHPDELDAMAGPGGAFGFSFYGNNSLETGNADWLIDYLKHYKPLFAQDGQAAESVKAFRHLNLYRLPSDTRMAFNQHGNAKTGYGKANATGRSSYTPHSSRTKKAYYKERAKDPAFRERRAAYARKYRATKKGYKL